MGFNRCSEDKADHCHEYHRRGYAEEYFRAEFAEDIGTGETAYGPEYEIEGCGECSLVQGESDSLHKDFRSRGVGAYIYAHVAHNSKEAEQHKWFAEEFETTDETCGLILQRRLFDFCKAQKESCYDCHYCIDRKQHSPVKSERRQNRSGSPHCYIRGKEGCNSLDELAESKG